MELHKSWDIFASNKNFFVKSFGNYKDKFYYHFILYRFTDFTKF